MVPDRVVQSRRLVLVLQANPHPHISPRAPYNQPFCNQPVGNPGAKLKPIFHRCYPILMVLVCELTKETINLRLGCPQGGLWHLALMVADRVVQGR